MQLIFWFYLTGGKLFIFAIWKHQKEQNQNGALSHAPSPPLVKLRTQSYPKGCREVWETHVFPVWFNHGASKRRMLQEAHGCVEQETATPEPVAQADAHKNTRGETGSLGSQCLSLIFNTRLRMYSPTAKSCVPESLVQSLKHHWCSSFKGRACFINQTSFSPICPPLLATAYTVT